MSNKKRRDQNKIRSGKRQRQNTAYGKTYSKRPTRSRSALSSPTSLGEIFQQGSQNTLDLVDRKPRAGAALNIAAYVLNGMVLGLAMGFIASLGTSGLPKVWAYVSNTFAVMSLRVILQWIWVLSVTTWVRKMGSWLIGNRTGLELPETTARQIPVTNNVSTIIGPAIVAVAIATILSTEPLEPAWLTRTWAIAGLSALGGGLAALMEALGSPSNIHALRWNRHSYQENPSFIQTTERHRTTGNRR